MEKRLIDATATKKALLGWETEPTDEEIEYTIDQLPTVDAVEVVHGEWIVCGDGNNVPWLCSHCGKTTAHKYKTMYGKYCPNCGADMRERKGNG